jgi:hypothetical protein
MDSNRTPGRDAEQPGPRQPRNAPRDERSIATASVPLEKDEADGQLGPDELSEPEEVVMNLEAKRHH